MQFWMISTSEAPLWACGFEDTRHMLLVSVERSGNEPGVGTERDAERRQGTSISLAASTASGCQLAA